MHERVIISREVASSPGPVLLKLRGENIKFNKTWPVDEAIAQR